MRRAIHAALAAAVLSLAAAGSAHADAPSPNNTFCEGTGKERCTACLEPLGVPPGPLDDYKACVATATGKGLKLACSDYSGGGGSSNHYYCPADVTLTLTSSSGSCALGSGSSAYAGLAGLLLLGLLWARRLRRGRA